jgi:dihydroorotate dehydrogenase electron transfer subunit
LVKVLIVSKKIQERAEILKKEILSPDIYRLTFHAPEIASKAKPGQFVMLRINDSYDPLLRRPFSIHQATANGNIQLLIKKLGKGTEILSLKEPGMEFDIIGPLGNGFSIKQEKNIFLAGGGLGVAPLLFLSKYIIQNTGAERLRLFIGMANKTDLGSLKTDFSNIGIEPFIATDDGSVGHHGLITELIQKTLKTGHWKGYSCGPYPMLRALSQLCNNLEWELQVSMETIMACGIGVCLGCSIDSQKKLLHVCKHGPVFNHKEVDWK